VVTKHKDKKYDDIIGLPHHVSKRRMKMSLGDRAVQFAPFSAVVGYDAAVKELGRYTEEKRELDEMEKEVINRRLNEFEDGLGGCDYEITYFQEDACKDGGRYLSHIGRIRKIDKIRNLIYMEDGLEIAMEDIFKMDVIT
jgi:hypothetical protein